MNITDITNAIGTVGFPIVMCCALFYYMLKETQKHEKEVHDMTDTINRNTTVLQELSTLIKTLIK